MFSLLWHWSYSRLDKTCSYNHHVDNTLTLFDWIYPFSWWTLYWGRKYIQSKNWGNFHLLKKKNFGFPTNQKGHWKKSGQFATIRSVLNPKLETTTEKSCLYQLYEKSVKVYNRGTWCRSWKVSCVWEWKTWFAIHDFHFSDSEIWPMKCWFD